MSQFQVNLSNCDREPIHIPGKVQAHGFLIACQAHNLQILYVSSNVEFYTGMTVAQVLKLNIEQLLQAPELELNLSEFKPLIAELQYGAKHEVAIPATVKQQQFVVIAHKNNGNLILEFEPQAAEVSNLKLNDTLGEVLAPLQGGVRLQELLHKLTWHIRDIIKYDRVMVYKYWEDWHGEVVAEEKREDLEPFLGLHYPASDIPRQARELYLLNLVRIIANVDAQPADLISQLTDTPLDLTYASLRAVSPMHIQYLKNMGVKASFSISLVHNGKLWGLIACHNYTPRFIDYESRKACKLLAQLLSTMLNTKLEEEQAVLSSKFKDEADHIFKTMYATGEIAKSLINNARSVLQIGNATGAALSFNDRIYTIGNTPNEVEITAIVKWLKGNAPTPLYHTNNLPKFFTKATSYSHIASGLMAAELFKNNGEYVLWFKPELSQTVKWAGNPQKAIEVDVTGATRLTPRQSFAVWNEEIKNTSENWGHAEILTALRLREGILQVISQKADETRKLNEKLKEAYDELDTFSYTISHDLRTPVSIIRNYAEILLDEIDTLTADETTQMLQRIVDGATSMDSLITHVLAYSRLSTLETTDNEPIDMQELLQEATDMAKDRYQKAQHAEIALLHSPSITAPRVMVKQIFCNLIENGLKYSSKEKKPKLTIKGEQFENEIIYTVIDNGIGIDANQSDKVFLPFKRLDNAIDFDGTGIGLATVKRLVKKLGGRIWFESKLNEGTTFFISFPLN